MNQLYTNQSKNKFKLSAALIDSTGTIQDMSVNLEQKEFILHVSNKKRRTIYMEEFKKIAELNKSEQLMFFSILENVNEYNVVISKWKDIAAEITTDPSRISKLVKSLKDKQFIAKIESKHFVNPFLILPVYNKDEPESGWAVQQIWKLYLEDMNLHIPVDKQSYINHIVQQDIFTESGWIRLGNKDNPSIIKLPED